MFHLYANNLQLYSQAKVEDVTQAINEVNRDLELIKSWLKKFGPSVNPTKCQTMITGSKRIMSKLDTTSISPAIFNGLDIPFSSAVKDLGLLTDSTLD